MTNDTTQSGGPDVEAARTPGPWVWKTTPGSDHEYCTVYSEATGRAVARHVQPCDAPTIAAAPELLEACKHLLWLVEVEHKIDGQHITKDAHGAIAKAADIDTEN